MADKLAFDEKAKRHAFVDASGSPAWHLKGLSVNGAMTSLQAIDGALLNWEAAKTPAHIILPDGTSKIIPGKFGIYRTDTNTPFSAAVGKNYTLVQNREAFEFFDAIVGEGEAIYETAGALYSGEQIFITAKLPSYIRVGKDDIIQNYLFLTNTHDGTGSIVAAFSPTRIVCFNTLMQALSDCSNKIRIRHTKDVVQRLREAHKIMGMSNMLTKELGEIFNEFAKKPITDKELSDYVRAVILPPLKEQVIDSEAKAEYSKRSLNIVNKILAYAQTNHAQQTETTKGTLFGAFQSISGYFQNLKTYGSADDKICTIIEDGTNQKAFDLALTMI